MSENLRVDYHISLSHYAFLKEDEECGTNVFDTFIVAGKLHASFSFK